jgi:hypothetical protein
MKNLYAIREVAKDTVIDLPFEVWEKRGAVLLKLVASFSKRRDAEDFIGRQPSEPDPITVREFARTMYSIDVPENRELPVAMYLVATPGFSVMHRQPVTRVVIQEGECRIL